MIDEPMHTVSKQCPVISIIVCEVLKTLHCWLLYSSTDQQLFEAIKVAI